MSINSKENIEKKMIEEEEQFQRFFVLTCILSIVIVTPLVEHFSITSSITDTSILSSDVIARGSQRPSPRSREPRIS